MSLRRPFGSESARVPCASCSPLDRPGGAMVEASMTSFALVPSPFLSADSWARAGNLRGCALAPSDHDETRAGDRRHCRHGRRLGAGISQGPISRSSSDSNDNLLVYIVSILERPSAMTQTGF